MVLSLESEDATCSVFVIVCKKIPSVPASGRKSAMVGCMPCVSVVYSLIPCPEPGVCSPCACMIVQMTISNNIIYITYDQHMSLMPPLHALVSKGYSLNLQHTKRYMLIWSILPEPLALHGEL